MYSKEHTKERGKSKERRRGNQLCMMPRLTPRYGLDGLSGLCHGKLLWIGHCSSFGLSAPGTRVGHLDRNICAPIRNNLALSILSGLILGGCCSLRTICLHNVALRCRVGLSSISSRLHLCDLSILLRLGSLCLFRGFLCSLSDLYDAATVACSSFVLLLATAFCVVVLVVLPILLLLCRFLGLAAIAPLLLFVASLFGLL